MMPNNMKQYQKECSDWACEAFGPETINSENIPERSARFLEEALELYQSLNQTKEDAIKLVEYVFSRDIGEPGQEVGGVMTTLATLCETADLCLDSSANVELDRVNSHEVMEKVRKKNASKPRNSPLPGSEDYGDRGLIGRLL